MNSCKASHFFDLQATKAGHNPYGFNDGIKSFSSSFISKFNAEKKTGSLIHKANLSYLSSKHNPNFHIKSSYANAYPDLSPDSPQANISTSASALEAMRAKRFQDSKNSSNSPSQPKEKKKEKDHSDMNLQLPAFQDLGLSHELLSAVESLDLTKPTEIQAIGIPAILNGEDVSLASHTGSGKTLAYLLPIVQLLRKDELESGRSTKPKRPRALVLCPTRELAEQVLRVAKSLCHHARFRSAMISGGAAMRPQEEVLLSPLDLLVGTPGRILQHFQAGKLYLGSVRYLVLDEADTMFDQGFGAELRKILSPLRARTSDHSDAQTNTQRKAKGGKDKHAFQTVMVTATITKPVERLLEEEFESIRHIRTDSLHKRVSTARHDFLPVSGSENKLDTVFQLVESGVRKGERLMLFCNTIPSSRAVDHYLNENGVKTLNYHGEVPAEKRAENIETFRNGEISVLKNENKNRNKMEMKEEHEINYNLRGEEEEEEEEGGDIANEYEDNTEYDYDANDEYEEDDYEEGEEGKWVEEEEEEEDKEEDYEDVDFKRNETSLSIVQKSKISEMETVRKFPVLVCTDLAARGLDLNVDHVIMFDFPRTPVDYLHRTGRTARNGAKGKITSLVTKRDELLARQIETSLKRNLSIENLSGDRGKVEAMKKREAVEKKKEKERILFKSKSKPNSYSSLKTSQSRERERGFRKGKDSALQGRSNRKGSDAYGGKVGSKGGKVGVAKRGGREGFKERDGESKSKGRMDKSGSRRVRQY